MRLLASLLIGICSLGCSGELAKDATAAVVGKGIEVSKSTVSGIAQGIAEGRKHGASADGALVVSTAEELAVYGGARVGDITAADGATTIAVLIENTAEQPLRASRLEVIVLDKDGVVAPTRAAEHEVTVPPRSKVRLEITTALAADRVGTVRLYGKDLVR